MATNTDKPKSTELNLNTQASEKASNATDLNLGTLTMADVTKSKDQKPSTELNIQPLPPEIVNQGKPKDQKPSTELNLTPLPPEITNQPKKKDEPIVFQTKVGDKIPDALNNIMLMSKEVHNDTINVDNSDPSKPKTYVPLIQSSIIEDPKTKEQTVVYHIKKFAKAMKPGEGDSNTGTTMQPSGGAGMQESGGTPQSQYANESESKLPDVLEYDYIYTGKNVDVLQFDMNVKLKFSSLTQIQVVHPNSNRTNQTVTPENEAATQEEPNEKTGEASEVNTSRVRGNKLVDVPKKSAIGITVVDPLRIGSGSLSPETLFAARKNLSDDLSQRLTEQVSTLKIVGNPLLLAGYTLPANTLGDSSEEPTSESINQKQQEHTDKTGGQTGITPTVKVNVRVPKPSYMQGRPLGNEDNFYSSPFWLVLNNFRINKITSKFTRGEFVQFLELQSLAEQSNTDYHSSDPSKPAKGGSGHSSTSPSDYGPNVPTDGTGVKPGYQKDFMDKNWNAANKAAEELGTDPKILLAQSAQEVGWGKGTVKGKDGTDSHNMFNIKADKNWHGPTVTKRALEYGPNGPYYSDQKFRAYSSPEESFADYAHFLKSNPRYNNITQNPTKDPMQYFSRLKQDHYATAPDYPQRLTNVYNSKAIKNYNPK